MVKKCFVCKLSQLAMTNILQHPKSLNLGLQAFFGLEAKEDDEICFYCYGEVINMIVLKPTNLKLPKENGVKLEEAIITEEQSEQTSHIPIVREIKHEKETTSDPGTSGLLSQVEPGGSGAHQSNTNLETTEVNYTCCFCFQAYPTYRGAATHIFRKHTKERSNVCNYCGKKYAFLYELWNHIRTHSGEKPYPCDYCSRGFSSQRGLTKHLRVHSNKNSCECTTCGRVFTSSSAIKAHNRSHMGSHGNAESHLCCFCGYCFNTSTYLRAHEKIHAGKGSFPCRDCLRTFSSNEDLESHSHNH